MKTFDYYVLKKTIWPLSAAVGIVLVALLLERLIHLLDLVVNQGGPFFLLLLCYLAMNAYGFFTLRSPSLSRGARK